MAFAQHLQNLFVWFGQMLNFYFDSSVNFGMAITNAILTMAIPMLHPKIFQSKLEFSK